MRYFALLTVFLLIVSAQCAAPLDEAIKAFRNADYTEALKILNKEIPADPEKLEYYLLRGDIYSAQGRSDQAIADYSEALKRKGDLLAAHYRRGMENFRSLKMKESIADFDEIAKLHPDRAPDLWQRGISLYYARQFEEGRKQFEFHQTVNHQDVENAVWHFICIAQIDGWEKARKQLIPISGDSRVPMQQIFSVFAGEAKPEDVFAAAKNGNPNPEQLKDRLFYAHLYLGLYEEARGNLPASLDHMRKAAGEFSQKHYMGDVARVHLALREKK